MSLFRNVFTAHKGQGFGPEESESDLASNLDDQELDREISTLISDGVSNGAIDRGEVQQSPQILMPMMAEQERAGPGKFDPLNRQDEAPIHATATSSAHQRVLALDPHLVERAVRAQSDIEKTHQRHEMKPQAKAPEKVSNVAAAVGPSALQQTNDTPVPRPKSTPKRESGARRVRTRMLGFDRGAEVASDPFDIPHDATSTSAKLYPVGWLVVTQGAGKGQSFVLQQGVSTIGRGKDQSIVLDFGDSSISRDRHAAIAYDDERNDFFLGHGGKANIVRLNGLPVLSTENLAHGDSIKIGETVLRFVAFCGPDFTWESPRHA